MLSSPFVRTILVLDLALFKHPAGGVEAGQHGTADAALQQRFDKSAGLGVLVEFAGEFFGQLQRLADAVRRDDGALVAHRHHLYAHQLALFLQPLAGTLDDADGQRIQVAKTDAAQILLVQRVNAVEIRVGRVFVSVAQGKRVADMAEHLVVVFAWQRVVQINPFVIRAVNRDLAREDVEDVRFGGIAPAPKLRAENVSVVHTEDIEQVPQLDRMQLHRRGGGENHRPGAGSELHSPLVEQILIGGLPHLGFVEIGTANFVRLVPEHATEPLLEQILRELPVQLAARGAQHHRSRHDGDLARAIQDIVLGGRMELVAFGEPSLAGPEGARRGEFINHLLLPLRDDCFRGDDEHRVVIERADEFSEAAHLERLAQADAIGQQVTRAASRQGGVAAMLVEGLFDEILLVIPEPEQLRAGRHFSQDWPDIGFLFPISDVLDDGALAQPPDLFDDEFADGETAFPQRIEFLLHPNNAVGVYRLPKPIRNSWTTPVRCRWRCP